jgi:hypothetical protein
MPIPMNVALWGCDYRIMDFFESELYREAQKFTTNECRSVGMRLSNHGLFESELYREAQKFTTNARGGLPYSQLSFQNFITNARGGLLMSLFSR